MIECSNCGDEVFCVSDGYGDWLCKDCFEDIAESPESFWDVARRQKEERYQRRRSEAMNEEF